LKEAFTELGQQFERAHPGAKVVFNFGSSGELCKQIEKDAPVDVFASASTDQIMELEKKELVAPDTVKNFAKNTLVMVQNPEAKSLTFAELAKVNRLSIGDPLTVPCGKYAKDALMKAGIYTDLETAHKLVFAMNVRQVLTYVDSGDVDAGIVYATDAAIGHTKAVSKPVPEKYMEPIDYPIALIRSSTHKQLAQEFIDLVTSPAGKSILQGRGFSS